MSDVIYAPFESLTAMLTRIFTAAGGAPEEARRIAVNLSEATARGHDSHGVVRTPRYVMWAQEGKVHFGRDVEVLMDGGGLALLDGRLGFGQTVGEQAVAFGIGRAQRDGAAVVGLRRAGHLGRIGAWGEMACAAGLMSIHFVNVQNSLLVAPFGGAGRRMSTAPVCVGVPNPEGEGGDFILDFATSRIAEGKALVALKGGKPAPEGALIDGEGRPSSDPRALYGDLADQAVPDPRGGPGALAAMGDHKGSGLALACELLAGALTGSGAGGKGAAIHNGMLSIYLDPNRFDDGFGWGAAVRDYVAFVRDCQPAAGVTQVQVPGDPERARRAERVRDGLPLPAAVWDGILDAGESVGLDRAALMEEAGVAR